MKSLTADRVSKVPGFTRNPSHDFSDDGTRFIGFEYKGLPLTQARSSRWGTFLSFRVDYLNEDTELPLYATFEEYRQEPWYPLCDKYNGVKELPSMDVIVTDLEKVLEGIKALNEKVLQKTINPAPILSRLTYELQLVETSYTRFRKSFDLFDSCYSENDISKIRSCMRSLACKKDAIESLTTEITSNKITRRKLAKLEENVRNGEIVLGENCYYIEKLDELLKKQAA